MVDFVPWVELEVVRSPGETYSCGESILIGLFGGEPRSRECRLERGLMPEADKIDSIALFSFIRAELSFSVEVIIPRRRMTSSSRCLT